ncbi:MAG: 2-haloalkanoic acid dehalogenase type II [Oceanicoccus sp.]|jgi:2-haloalkanoic acid dehalogenase type II
MSDIAIPQSVKIISFDLDDTLWSGNQVIAHAENTMLAWMQANTPEVLASLSQLQLRDKKIQFIQANPHLSNKISLARQQFLQALFQEFGYHNAQQLAQACFDAFYEARQNVVLFDDVLETLSALKKVYQLIAITNGNADIHKTGLGHLFEFCLQAESFVRPKPHSDIFHHALERLDCSAQQVLHVGDHPVHDMQGAFDVGMKTVWLQDGTRAWDQVFEPDLIIQHIRELV